MTAEVIQTRRKVLVRAALVLGLFALLVGLVLVLAFYSPGESSFFPRCMLHAFTGLHCPGCGTTRATHSLLNGDISQALAYNLLIPMTLPFFAYHILITLFRMALGQPATPSGSGTWTRRYGVVLIVTLALFGILRNIPVEPLTKLAPHKLAPTAGQENEQP